MGVFRSGLVGPGSRIMSLPSTQAAFQGRDARGPGMDLRRRFPGTSVDRLNVGGPGANACQADLDRSIGRSGPIPDGDSGAFRDGRPGGTMTRSVVMTQSTSPIRDRSSESLIVAGPTCDNRSAPTMASDPKATTAGSPAVHREKGVRIFTYPKIIFIFPTLIMSLICWLGMWWLGNPDNSYVKSNQAGQAQAGTVRAGNENVDGDLSPISTPPNDKRLRKPENLLGLMFLGVLFFNLLILAIDFPRFTIFALILLGTTVLFFLLWLGVFVRILEPLEHFFERVYVRANAQFYFMTAMVLLAIYATIFISRWLDYWEIMPNEILHHHGPLSDLERYPTLNLKFDKEIPDVFEHLMFGAGRLVLHVSDERKAIVLDTVLHVSQKEAALKNLMSRLEVRVTTDQEVASP
jgi:hypothetical protein